MKPKTSRLADVACLNPRDVDARVSDTPVSFIAMADVNAETGITSRGEKRNYADVAKGYTQFQDGDILVAKITPCFENGKIAQARLDCTQAAGSTEFHVIRPERDRVDDRYLLRYLRQPRIRVAGEMRMTGSAGQRRVPGAFLADLKIPLPKLHEQRRIADALDRIDELHAKRRKTITLLEDLAQSIFLDMFGDPADNNNRRPLIELSELIDKSDRINYGVVQPGEDPGNGVPLVRAGDLVDGKVNRVSLRTISADVHRAYRRSRIRGNEILVGCVGAIGAIAVASESEVGLNIARAVARVPVADYSMRRYLAHYLRTEHIQRYFVRELRTVAQPTLNIKQISQTPISKPPYELARRFSSIVDSVDALRQHELDHQVQLDALFDSVQQRAFNGELFDEAEPAATGR